MYDPRQFSLSPVRRAWCTGCAIAVVAGSVSARAATEIPLAEGTLVRFAEVREAAEALTRRDQFVKQMSPFDRQVRLRTDSDVSEDEVLAFAAAQVVPWTRPEVQKLVPLVEALARKTARFKLRLPPVVLLVKTTGREEGGAAYCRGAAIVLPRNKLEDDVDKLARLLAHELFHVLSSHNPKLRDALYATIGFRPTGEVRLPDSLRERKITNPDAPVLNHVITVTQDGRRMQLVPVLFSKSARYDPQGGGNLFSYLTFKLMAVEERGGQVRPTLAEDGQPVLLDPASVPDYHEQVGRNTRYIIHPEEVLADNFVLLVQGRRDVPTPRVLEQMREVLNEAAGGTSE